MLAADRLPASSAVQAEVCCKAHTSWATMPLPLNNNIKFIKTYIKKVLITSWAMTPIARRRRPTSSFGTLSVTARSAVLLVSSVARPWLQASASHVRAESCLPPDAQPTVQCALQRSGVAQLCGTACGALPVAYTGAQLDHKLCVLLLCCAQVLGSGMQRC